RQQTAGEAEEGAQAVAGGQVERARVLEGSAQARELHAARDHQHVAVLEDGIQVLTPGEIEGVEIEAEPGAAAPSDLDVAARSPGGEARGRDRLARTRDG